MFKALSMANGQFIYAVVVIIFFMSTKGVMSQCRMDRCPVAEVCKKYFSGIYGCNASHPFHCGLDQNNEIMRFCHTPHECKTPGTANNVWYVDGVIQLICSECKNGTYQPYGTWSPTVIGCDFKHKYADGKPSLHVVLLKPGTTTSQPTYYCDYEQGFFNTMRENYCTPYTECICEDVKEYPDYRCRMGFTLIPNGTCLEDCPVGVERDRYKDFICSGNMKSTTTTENKTTEEKNTTTAPVRTSSTPNTRERDKSDNSQNTGHIVGGVIGGLGLCAVIAIPVLICKKKISCYTKVVNNITDSQHVQLGHGNKMDIRDPEANQPMLKFHSENPQNESSCDSSSQTSTCTTSSETSDSK